MSAPTKKMRITEIAALEDFRDASDSQQWFVLRYITGGGGNRAALDAVKFAYKVNPKYARSLKCQVLASPRIQRILNAWLGGDDMDLAARKLKPLLDFAIRRDKKRKKGISTSTERTFSVLNQHVRMRERLERGLNRLEPDPDGVQKYAVGAVVEQNGKRYKIVAEEIV